MCECGDPYFTDELYYQQAYTGYPQSYPQKLLSDSDGCAILSGQAAKLAGEATRKQDCCVAFEPLDGSSGTLNVLRVEHLREQYARFAPEFRTLAVCG
jgi:hypothetical protein